MMTSHKLLNKYYTQVDTIHDYLSRLVPEVFIELPDDPPSFAIFHSTCLVACCPATDAPEPTFDFYEPTQTQSELIKKAQFKLLKARQRTNVLNLGFRLPDERDSTHDIVVNFAVNTNVDKLKTPEWRKLLHRIGDGPMFHLLTTCSIFIPVGNDCHVQLAGSPISELDIIPYSSKALGRGKRRTSGGTAELERPKKQVRADQPTPQPRKTNSPTDIPLPRNKLFYAKAQRSRAGEVQLGLPEYHTLFRVEPDNIATTTEEMRAKNLQKWARHLSKYIFPRQYGLSNVFTAERDPKSRHPFPSYDDREDDILIMGACKTPKRVKPCLSLIEQLVRYHQRTPYPKLCNFICPTKTKAKDRSARLDPDEILTLIAEEETSQPLATQAANISADISHRSLIFPHGASEAKQQVKAKPKFAEFACSHSNVYQYVANITLTVIPRNLWGSKKNLKVILKHIASFITYRRSEVPTLHTVLQGLSLHDCDWLVPDGTRAQSQRSTPSDDMKRRELLHEFIYWFFDSFLTPLLKTTFYITESSAFRNEVLYFRQDDWTTLCAPLINRLAQGTFSKLDITKEQANSILKSRQLGYSHVRLLPKDTGVRPIVNLRRKSSTKYSINQILQNAFQILSFEKNSRPNLLGASIFGMNEIYSQIKEYRERVRTSKFTLPKFYFVKVDVRAAFDSIDQDKLIDVLYELLSQEEYTVKRWSQVAPTSIASKRSFHRQAMPRWEQPSFPAFAETLAKVLQNSVFVDKVNYSSADRDAILRLLEEHVTRNMVKIGPHFYQQTVGIPQGSVLSTLLCSFFYGDMEKRKFNFRDDPCNLLLRYVDDYLLVTTKLPMARKFLEMMTIGHPEYGCFITPDKTLTNFDSDSSQSVMISLSQKLFPWCGLRIETDSLRVQADYTRFHGTHVSSTLSVQRGKNPGAAFRQKMIHAAKMRNHVIFNDTNLNGRKIVYVNVFQNFLFTAMKMHGYLKSWGAAPRETFILDVIMQCVMLAYVGTCTKVIGNLAKSQKASFTLQRPCFIWLGLKAFHSIFSRKRTGYGGIVEGLEKRLASTSPRGKAQVNLMKQVIKKSWQDGLNVLQF
ncbi:hypothetical protein FRB93_008431 [Tulasnella sp. JGI-2019a]|nr:hypothetical protein FRB93_008431 [Tulasnella sp. JGI-2019a]